MELMEGGELFDRISQEEFFTEETAAMYMLQVELCKMITQSTYSFRAKVELCKMIIQSTYSFRAKVQNTRSVSPPNSRNLFHT